MKELNVIAEISPPMYFWNTTTIASITALGEERVRKAHPVKDMLDAGLLVTYGSDWPASCPTVDPWRNLEGLVTRLNPEGEYREYGQLGEPIDLASAIQIMTMNGAQAMGNDKVTGSIKVGKYADIVVLDQNPFELVKNGKPDKIGDMLVLKTVFEGEVVYDRLSTLRSLNVIEIDITNSELDNAIDAAELNLIIEGDLGTVVTGQCSHSVHESVEAGNIKAPEEINISFEKLHNKGLHFARSARKIYWKNTDRFYWIQWTVDDDDVKTLWAYDPDSKDVVEVLKVSSN
jgi:hypothetical protein